MTADYKSKLDELISIVVKEDASDLHLSEGRQPVIRVSGFLVPLIKQSVLSRVDIKGILDELIDTKKKEEFLEQKEVDFAFDQGNSVRFRGNAFYQIGKISIALRLIPKSIKTLEELRLPAILETFVNKQQGFLRGLIEKTDFCRSRQIGTQMGHEWRSRCGRGVRLLLA